MGPDMSRFALQPPIPPLRETKPLPTAAAAPGLVGAIIPAPPAYRGRALMQNHQ
jgi:hypothetical protein